MRATFLCILMACLGILTWWNPAYGAERVIAPHNEATILELVEPYVLGVPHSDGLVLWGVAIKKRRVDFRFVREDREPVAKLILSLGDGESVRARLEPPADAIPQRFRSKLRALEKRCARSSLPTILVKADLPKKETQPFPWWWSPILLAALFLPGALLIQLTSLGKRLGLSQRAAWTSLLIVSFLGALLPLWVLVPRFSVKIAVVAALSACVGALALALLRRVSRASLAQVSPPPISLDTISPLVVTACSLGVRFGLTRINLLTDGGSGYGRLHHPPLGFLGLSELFHALLPGVVLSHLWSVIWVPAILSALSPPFLLILARSLGMSRMVSLLAGLCLACLPLHAAMFHSDFLAGPVLSLVLLGMLLLAKSRSGDRPELAMAGGAVLAFCAWGRPEVAVVAAPAVLLLRVSRGQWSPLQVLAAGWLALNVMATVLIGLRMPEVEIAPAIEELPWMALLSTSIAFPWWFAAAPLGFWKLYDQQPRLVLGVLVLGVVCGMIPMVLRAGTDHSGTYLEIYRYSTFALPWLVLAAGQGLAHLLESLGSLAGDGWRQRFFWLTLGAVSVVPLVHTQYLGEQYAHAPEEHVFREALARVPQHCGIIVPEDEGGSMEVLERYLQINQEVYGAQRRSVLGTREVQRELDDRETLPGKCWYFFRGSHCYVEMDGRPSTACDGLDKRLELEPISLTKIRYVSHRLVSRPDATLPGLRIPQMELGLFRVGQR